MQQLLKFRCKLFELRENREIPVETFSALLSTILYEKRFGPWFCEPIVAGLKEDNTPFLSGMDLIGAPVFTNGRIQPVFVCYSLLQSNFILCRFCGIRNLYSKLTWYV